nr:F-box domain-containing protein [Tanacetum cinerariifolium]
MLKRMILSVLGGGWGGASPAGHGNQLGGDEELAERRRKKLQKKNSLLNKKRWPMIPHDLQAQILRDILIKDSETAILKRKLEKISKEKDDIDIKIEKFKNASQNLDKLIGSQITDNSKRGLGYVSYNAVPPPHTGLFSPLRIDLSHTGLLEFAEPSVKIYEVKPIKVVHHSLRTGNQMKRMRLNLLLRCKYHQRERMVNGTYHSRMYHSSNTVPKAMLTRTGLKPINFVRVDSAYSLIYKQSFYHCYFGFIQDVDAAVVTTWGVLFVILSQNIVKLLGFTIDDDPIVEVDSGQEMVHTLQVYDHPSQQFHSVGIEGDVGSIFIGLYKESLILLNV